MGFLLKSFSEIAKFIYLNKGADNSNQILIKEVYLFLHKKSPFILVIVNFNS